MVFIAVADVDWPVAGLIAVGSVVGGQLGATRRTAAAAPPCCAAVIVVVGAVAVVALLLS